MGQASAVGTRSATKPGIMPATARRRLAMTDRFAIDPAVCHGRPVVRGTRTPVTVILDALAGGDSFETIQRDYDITADDIRACIAFASEEINRTRYFPASA